MEIPQNINNEGWKLVDGDELINQTQIANEMKFAANCAAGQCTSLPETNLMTIKVN